MRAKGILRYWLIFSMITVILGVVMLWPIGTVAFNILFLVIKCGMAAGILGVLLSMKKPYLVLWCFSSFAAIFMTIAKWSLSGAFRGSFALAMGTDIVVPVVGALLWRKYHE